MLVHPARSLPTRVIGGAGRTALRFYLPLIILLACAAAALRAVGAG